MGERTLEAKKALQAELLVLRDKHGVKLSKGEGDTLAKFKASVEAPDASAAAYDVGPITLQCTVHASIMGAWGIPVQHAASLAHAPAAEPAGPAPDTAWKKGLKVEVSAPDLPKALTDRIATRLHAGWALSMQQQLAKQGAQQQQLQPGAFQLEVVILMLSTSFVKMLNLIPDLVEPYEGTDAQGRTMRRFTIITGVVSHPADPTPTIAAAPTPKQAAAAVSAAANAAQLTSTTAPTAAHVLAHGAGGSHSTAGSPARAVASQAFAAAAAALGGASSKTVPTAAGPPSEPAATARHDSYPAGSMTGTSTGSDAPARPGISSSSGRAAGGGGGGGGGIRVIRAEAREELTPLSVKHTQKLLDELRYLGKRYGASFKLLPTHSHSHSHASQQGHQLFKQQRPAAASRGDWAAAGAGVAAGDAPQTVPPAAGMGTGVVVSASAASGAGQAAPTPQQQALPSGFELQLLPTDKEWGWGPIRLEARITALPPPAVLPAAATASGATAAAGGAEAGAGALAGAGAGRQGKSEAAPAAVVQAAASGGEESEEQQEEGLEASGAVHRHRQAAPPHPQQLPTPSALLQQLQSVGAQLSEAAGSGSSGAGGSGSSSGAAAPAPDGVPPQAQLQPPPSDATVAAPAAVQPQAGSRQQPGTGSTRPRAPIRPQRQAQSAAQAQAQPQPVVALVTLGVAPGNPMPNWLTRHVDRVLSQQMLASAGRPTPMACALRHLENYGGEVAAQAEALAREAGQRTRLGQHGGAAAAPPPRVRAGDGGADLAMAGHSSGSEGEGGSSDSYDSQASSSDSESEGSHTSSDRSGSEEEGEESEDEEGAANEIEFHAAGAGGDDSAAAGARAGKGGTGTAPGYAVVLEGLQLDNVLAAEAVRAVFQVVCDRCSHTGEMILSSEAVASTPAASSAGSATATKPFEAAGACPGCHAPWGLAMRPKFVHEHSNVLCSLKPAGVRPLDLLPSLMAAQCAGCGGVMSLRGVQVGMPCERTCSSCHHHLSLTIPAVSFVPRGPTEGRGNKGAAKGGVVRAAAAARAAAPRGAMAAFNGVLQIGQPLPAYGTCRHYKHSYRWLRFPCCGMRFPCDLCHEEFTPDGHEPRWAQRMVCGFCATEQPVGGVCKACGKTLARGAGAPSGKHTRFWEGGEGCRDKNRMHRNDPHKYRNSKNKTQSAKHKRVGPKVWSKELKKEAAKAKE